METKFIHFVFIESVRRCPYCCDFDVMKEKNYSDQKCSVHTQASVELLDEIGCTTGTTFVKIVFEKCVELKSE